LASLLARRIGDVCTVMGRDLPNLANGTKSVRWWG
jgi:hypothetical protein